MRLERGAEEIHDEMDLGRDVGHGALRLYCRAGAG
jgi:hypothetical protein